ncbi:MAG TPA: NADH oxidoreductase (quinone) subunit F [Deltaproteobacteria bacterium]|jgi:NADH-quinone oxidoreductase subunit F|nr:NADH-quinone oxidoreductase subunit F [Deltaproteobacteria bacterium]MDE0906539.1 NADH-quinone oxidoreductase subunit NuoF [SAR324 cluster bacterium]HIF69468.1 NADH-quinone oxidoreductase subunit NuoF [Candidatus Lambdaproteobacteria bacterium]HIL15633.1 NADH oxidoreductase (quinone) subunit F [Deltaproteobacteria bacterium]|tara:strand:+ start:825 stop:2084 length:1260 start_codon:yes stop_codon:yes gene_type:complete
MLEETLVLFRNIRNSDYDKSLKGYKKTGGFTALRKALEMQPGEIVQLTKDSGLRGRGGAGFPTGLKWSFMAKGTGKPTYLVCNADESEPGTCKDRELMLHDPHQFLEGMMISCLAIGCRHGYIYVRGEYWPSIKSLNAAVQELYDDGILGEKLLGKGPKLDLTVHPGAGAYICGEETALLDSIEGKRGHPRVKPPFPAVSGFNACPTTVNNVETLACLPFIVNEGAEVFKSFGPENNAGTHLISLSGHVNKPGVYEVRLDANLKDIIYDLGGGIPNGKKLKGVIPGGASSSVLTAAEIDVTYSFDALAKAGTMMGSAAIMVFDEDTDAVKLLHRIVRFFSHESCGQCTPCREGTHWARMIIRDFLDGNGNERKLKRLHRVGGNMIGTTVCALGDACGMPIQAFTTKFADEFREVQALAA